MEPLPFVFARCRPELPDSWCHRCRRYAEHDEQTFAPIQLIIKPRNSTDEYCQFIPTREGDLC